MSKKKHKNKIKNIRTVYLVWTLVTSVRKDDGTPENLTKENIIGMAEVQNNWQVSERGSYIGRDVDENI